MHRMTSLDVAGRDLEVFVLRGALAEVVYGRGRAVLVEGEPGIGKSAVLDAALADPPSGLELVRGTCDEWGRRYALTAVLTALAAASDAVLGDAAKPPSAYALRAGPLPRTAAGEAVMAAVDSLLVIVEKLCALRPVVFVLEDLHWADEATLMFWRELCARAERLPLLLIGTQRPLPRRTLLDRLREELPGLDGLVVSLGRLSADAVTELATRLRGTAPEPRLTALLETASGNPLYVSELLDSLARLGVQEPPELFASLSDLIGDRLDFLAPGSRDVLRSAAVLGNEFPDFSVRELAVVLDRPTGELRVLLDEAVAAGLLEAADDVLRFRHELIRRQLYDAIPAGLRMALHRYSAKILIGLDARPERIARHLLAGQGEAESWEADWLVEHAGTIYASEPETAAELLHQVVPGLDPADPRFAELKRRWADFTFLLGRYQRAAQVARGILTHTEDAERVGHAVWILALCLMSLFRFEEALDLLVLTARRPGISAFWRARHDAVHAVDLQLLGRLDEALLLAERALGADRTPEDPFTACVALYARSTVRAERRDLAGALADAERGLEAANLDPDLGDARMLLRGNRHAYRYALGEHAGAVRAMQQVLATAERTDSLWLARVRRQTAELLYELGHWDEVHDRLRPYHPLLWHAFGALVAAHRDETDEASRHLQSLESELDAASLPGTLATASMHVHALSARALECERTGPPGDGAAVLSVCLEPGAEDRLPLRYLVMPALVRLAGAAGDAATARAGVEVAEWEAAQEPIPRKQAVADWCRGMLTADPDLIAFAAAYFHQAGLRLDRGNALEDAAELYAQAGDGERARLVLVGALAVYEELGATWDARRAASRLRAYDVRLGVRGSRTRAGAGGQGLTTTEQRVAELVAEGCSNPDIAARMFLSRRTVETHVSNILAKLQVSSRREVRDRLGAEP